MNKLFKIIALSLVAVITVTLVTLAIIKTDFNQVNLQNIESVVVYNGTANNTFVKDVDGGSKVIDNVVAKLQNGTKESVLSSLLQRAYSEEGKATLEKEYFSFAPETGKVVVAINYKEGSYPKLTLNGSVYIDENLTTEVKTVSYKTVYIEVVDSEELSVVNAYFVESTSENRTQGNYQMSFLGHLSSLYDYIDGLNTDGFLFN